MKNITGFCTVLLAILQLNAQKSYEPFVKTLSQTGLSSYYSKDLEANINSWIKNENEVVSKMLGKFQAYEKDLEYITKDFGLPWFIKYIPAANTGLDVHFQSKTDGARGIWPLEYQIAKKYDDLYKINQSEMPADIQAMIDKKEIGAALLRIIEVIGPERIEDIDEDTVYFIINTLNQLNVDSIRNKLLLKVLPLKV